MANRMGCSTQREEVEKECRRAVKEFQRVFGRDAKPELGSYAPGRVNLMGGSIDYSGGPVIPVVSYEPSSQYGSHYLCTPGLVTN